MQITEQMILRFNILLFLSSAFFISNGQTEFQKDSLINEICKTINATPQLSDSIRVQHAFQTHLFPYANRLNERDGEEFRLSIFYRLHRSCTEFYRIQYRLKKPNSDITAVETIPKTKLNKKDCGQFLKHKQFFSIESLGDTSKSVIRSGIWIQTFKDNTNSRLKFKWLSDCEFELEFIEATNASRAKISKPGDKYIYKILEKEDAFYLMSVEIPGNDARMTFKLYY